MYTRNSIISTHQPLSLFIKVDPHAVFSAQEESTRSQSYAIVLTQYCLKYGIDGIVLCHDSTTSQDTKERCSQLTELIRAIRSEDKDNKLIVMSAGCR